MITTNEINIANNSYLKKDFYQIYPEILDIVSKITERWDPASSNESDPGVVLLKLLAFIADKNNYNIDKNILECFMPSCTQTESMRKLCEMLGYEMQYYNSATTNVTFMYQGSSLKEGDQLIIPQFTVITNEDKDINYITTEECRLNNTFKSKSIKVIEGKYCPIDSVVTLNSLDDQNRYYLPESQIAENGIFVSSVEDNTNSIEWKKKSNLNTQPLLSYVYKFGYDSRKKLPYIQFPSDIASLIGNGLNISYVRTTGSIGNVSAKTLSKFTVTEFKTEGGESILVEDGTKQNIIVSNLLPSTNGRDMETINEAYNNFKKVVGTFDTLVTCRDYANAIYNMVSDQDNNTPIVSNVIVSDIRDDLNNSYKVMTFNEFGLCFDEQVKQVSGVDTMSCFDLFIYPFKMITGAYTNKSYVESFKPDNNSWYEITRNLEDSKTIAHNIKPAIGLNNTDDIFCIKNYVKLNARINTTYKVNKSEEKLILTNIYNALYKKFNSRNIDFGEEIPYETIFSVIQEADPRIKNVTLDEPTLTTKLMLTNGAEVAPIDSNYQDHINDLIVKNILAGRLNYLNLESELKPDFGEASLDNISKCYWGGTTIDPVEESDDEESPQKDTITQIKTELQITNGNYTLGENENINFIAPNYSDSYIYPVGVNYFWTGREINKNEVYQLTGADHLYINYTDSDNITHSKVYSATSITDNGSTIESGTRIFIRPSFSLKKSTDYGEFTTPSKKAGLEGFGPNWETIFHTAKGTGMFTLNSAEQIARVGLTIDTIDNLTPIFWITKTGDLENGHILEAGEYFFRTNESKTNLVTYGTGTKILLEGFDNDKISSSVLTKDIDLDAVANYGIAAFEDNPWYVVKDISSSKTIQLQEMQLITLGANDALNSCVLRQGPISDTNYIGNDYKEVASADYDLDGKNNPSLPTLPGNTPWQVRSRLNLNVGPNSTLVLKPTSNSKKILELVHEKYISNIGGTTSFGDPTTLLSLKVVDSSVESPNGSTIGNTETVITDETVMIRSNYLLQEAGNEIIDTKITTDSNQVLNDLKLYIYKKAISVINDETTEFTAFHNYDDNHTLLNTSVNRFKFYLNSLDNNHFNLLMIYRSDVTAPVTISSTTATLFNYNEGFIGEGSSINMPDNKNMIVIGVSGASTITITKASNCNVVISDISCVKRNNAMDYLGFNLDTLGITSSDINNIANKLKGHNFYYNAPLDQTLLIDVTSFNDPRIWYDYNNIVNKFVISQIDSSSFEKDITLTAASRLK